MKSKNPKEKAKELVEKFSEDCYVDAQNKTYAKECAVIAVNILIDEHTFTAPIKWNTERKNYWTTVKSEIEKL